MQIIISSFIALSMVVASLFVHPSVNLGANSTISNLTAKTSPAGDDLIAIVDTSTLTTKKLTFANATSSFKTYNDLIYSPIAGSASIVTVGAIGTGSWNATAIPVAKGGTGTTTFASNYVLLGDGASGLKTVNGQGTSGYLLTSNGAGSAPTWQNVAVALNTDNTWTGAQTFSTATTTFNSTTTSATSVKHFNNGNFSTTTSGGTINGGTLPVPVSMSTSTSRVIAMDGNDMLTMDSFVGFAVNNSTNGTEAVVQTDGIVNGFSGLTVGRRYYVQDAIGTIGVAVGTYDFYVGIAVSATALLIDRSEGGSQYIGSATITQSAADLTSCSGTAPAPPLTRFANVNIAAASGARSFNAGGIVSMVGATSYTQTATCSMNVADADACSITASIAAGTVSMSHAGTSNATNNWACSGTIYYYR